MMNKTKLFSRLLAALGCLVLAVLFAPAAMAAAPATWDDVQGAITNAASGDVIDLSGFSSPNTQRTFIVGSDRTLTIIGNSNETFANVAFVFGEGNTITIKDLNITSADDQTDNGYSPLHFTGTGNTLTLVGDNTITSGQYAPRDGYGAAVGVPKDAALTIDGTGRLAANSGTGGAGIGGGYYGSGGTITIVGGTVSAQGGIGGAGIGGGWSGGGGNITIGGNAVITLAEGDGGAGIGGGIGGGGGNITIGGNAVIALAEGGDSAAGIGGGAGGAGGNITISGGNTTAQGGIGGAGIGGGQGRDGGKITITGGIVTATGGTGYYSADGVFGGGAGIGGGGGYASAGPPITSGASGTIAITGNVVVTAKGGDSDGENSHGGAGIGSGGAGDYLSNYGDVGTANTITINTSGVVTVTMGEGKDGSFPGARIGLGGSHLGAGAEKYYLITATATSGGTVSYLGCVSAPANTDKTYFITPAANHKISYVRIDGAYIPEALSGRYTFTNITADHTIHVVFETLYGGPMQPSVVTLTPSMNPYYGLGGLGLTSSGFVGQFRALSMNGQPLTEGVDYTVENAGGLAVLHVSEAVLAGITGDVRFEAVFSDATGSCTVRVQSAAVPEDITTAPPKTGDGAGYAGIALMLFALAGMRVMRANQGNNTKQMRGTNA